MKKFICLFAILSTHSVFAEPNYEDFIALYKKYKSNCSAASQDPLIGVWTYEDKFLMSKGAFYALPIDENNYAGFLKTKNGVISVGRAPREYREDGAIGHSGELTSVSFGDHSYKNLWKLWETSGHAKVCLWYGAGESLMALSQIQRKPCDEL